MAKKILAHFCVIMFLVFLTLFVVDQINSAMGFVNNQITKVLMIVTLPIAIVTMYLYINDMRAEQRRRMAQTHKRRPIGGEPAYEREDVQRRYAGEQRSLERRADGQRRYSGEQVSPERRADGQRRYTGEQVSPERRRRYVGDDTDRR